LLPRTHPYDYFFGDQWISFSLRLRNPSRLAYVTPYAFTRPTDMADLVESLETRNVQFVSWYPGLDSVPTNAAGNSLAPLRRELLAHYHVAADFSNGNKVWERNWRGAVQAWLSNSIPDGPTGKVKLTFLKDCTRFEDAEDGRVRGWMEARIHKYKLGRLPA
jgi:hypothetical protein